VVYDGLDLRLLHSSLMLFPKARARFHVMGSGLHDPGRFTLDTTNDSGAVESGGDGPSIADERDNAADRRDQAADERDRAAAQRDDHADQRDEAADRRDQSGEWRDRAAAQRDQVAQQSEEWIRAGIATDADVHDRAALARRDAASDRSRASQDRGQGASERKHAELDRETALDDREASAMERKNAVVDDLTGVYTRAAGFLELEREIARARRTKQPLVLAFVDVDRLKAINDSRGHPAGDRLLLEVGNALRAQLRSHDLIFRYGGDEFVCVIAGLDRADAARRLALVNAELAAAREHGSITVGVAELEPDDSPDDLVARADAALYRHREQQRNEPGLH
jgi:diguanylate cyclase (GGDEF)-like protein